MAMCLLWVPLKCLDFVTNQVGLTPLINPQVVHFLVLVGVTMEQLSAELVEMVLLLLAT
jgi:hypothetical protein